MTVPPCRQISLVEIATISLRKYFLYILRLAHELAIMKSLYTVRMIVASPPRESSLHTFARSYYYYYYYYYSCSYISSPPLQNSHTTIESADYNKATYEYYSDISSPYLFTLHASDRAGFRDSIYASEVPRPLEPANRDI